MNQQQKLDAIAQGTISVKDLTREELCDPELALALVQKDSSAFSQIWQPLQDIDEIALAAIKQSPQLLKHASVRLRNDPATVLVAVTKDGMAIAAATRQIKENKTIALAAIRQNAYAVRHVCPNLQDNKEVMLAAVEQRGEMLECGSPTIRNDLTIVKTAIEQNSFAFQFASPDLKGNPDLAILVFKKVPNHPRDDIRQTYYTLFVSYVDPKLLQSPDFAGRCLEEGLDVNLIAEQSGDFVLALTQYLLTRPTEQLQHTQHEGALLKPSAHRHH